jgi:hypothetical protein
LNSSSNVELLSQTRGKKHCNSSNYYDGNDIRTTEIGSTLKPKYLSEVRVRFTIELEGRDSFDYNCYYNTSIMGIYFQDFLKRYFIFLSKF